MMGHVILVTKLFVSVSIHKPCGLLQQPEAEWKIVNCRCEATKAGAHICHGT